MSIPFPIPRRVTLLAAAAVLVSSSAAAETLPDVIAYAYQTNPGVQAQRAALRGIDENYVQARAGFAPSVSVSTGATDYNIREGVGRAHSDTNSAALSVVQPVYSGGRLTSRLRATEAQILSAREGLRRVELDLLQRVVTAYVNVRRDLQVVQISQDTVAVLTSELKDTQARFDVREVTRTDLAQAQARLAQAKTQLLNAQAQLGISRAAFLGVVGRNPGELAPPPQVEALPATPDQAFDAAEANNPQLQSARFAEEGSRASIAEARAARRPSITARFDMQRTPRLPYSASIYDNARSTSITLSQPLFTGGQISSQIRQAIEANNRDRLTIDDTRLQVLQQVAGSWEQLVAFRQQLTTAQDEMRATEIAYAGVREEQKQALRSTIEVLNAELELSNAEQNLARTRASEYVARVQLLAAMGVLTPDTLAKGVPTYDAAEHFRKIRYKGLTPLEVPARILDAVAAPHIGRTRPASIEEVKPLSAPSLPALPADADAPIPSIYETILHDKTLLGKSSGSAAASPPAAEPTPARNGAPTRPGDGRKAAPAPTRPR